MPWMGQETLTNSRSRDSGEAEVCTRYLNMRTLIQNARMITTDTKGPRELCCLAVNDHTIQHIGHLDDASIQNFLRHGEEVQIVDLQGRGIMPSFIDGHTHLLQFGISLSKVSLGNCANLEEIRQVIQSTAQEEPDAQRLMFQAWKQSATGSLVSSEMLNDLSERPIYIESHDLHAVWCNAAAVRELEIPDEDIPGGRVHRTADHLPTGLFEDAAVLGIIWPFLTQCLTHEEKLDRLREAIETYNRAGYTSAIDMAVDEDYWNLLRELYEKGELNLRLAVHFLVSPTGSTESDVEQVRHVSQLHEAYNILTSPDFRVAGIKLMCDGVIDSCTAAISEPYKSTGQSVQPYWTAEALSEVLTAADDGMLQVAMHAIGDEAVTMAINGLEALGTTGKRHRIEHLEVTKPEDAKRLGRLGITASIQPVHCDPIQNIDWTPLIGQKLCGRAFAYREFADHGARIAIGSDAPTAPHSPWNNLFNATTRKSYNRPYEEETMNAEFKLTLVQALAATNIGAAYSCFAEDMVGSLEVGKRADFIVLDPIGDWKGEPLSLLSCNVTSTWLGGRKAWSKD
ncbi:amidohydrolase family protein [Colletotrichum scovillei]|nr:amidohydrolase family protein [Colletotrichum scovillei]